MTRNKTLSHNLTIISLFAFLYLSSIPLFAMNETDELSVSSAAPAQKHSASYIEANDRFELIKKYYKKYPDLSMLTPLTELYEDLYQKDYAFIKGNIQTRENAEVVLKMLNDLNEHAKANYQKEMTFADYNFIAQKWVGILTERGHQYDPSHLKNISDHYTYALKVFAKTGRCDIGFPYYWAFIEAPGIVCPHVSPTGSVPLLVMNRGYGFFIDRDNPGSVDYLAVGTDMGLSFDYFKDQCSQLCWYHDYEHLCRAGRANTRKEEFKIHTHDIADLRSRMAEISDPTLSNQAELAFFDLFHESQQEMTKINEPIDSRLKIITETLKKDIVPTTGFNSELQYKSYIEDAKSLGLLIEGETLLEKYRSYLQHLKKGYEQLKIYAPDYDQNHKARMMNFYKEAAEKERKKS